MNFIALSGLPRTGSTLLSSILSQNPDIHAEGNSAVCQLMWDMQISCEYTASQQITANYRFNTQDDLVSSIPGIYYKDVEANNIVDKCRSWTLEPNMKMIRRYIRKDPKVIVLTRPIDEIVESFVRLRKLNGWTDNFEEGLLDKDSEPIMRSLNGVEYALNNNNGEFIFIEYNDLVLHTNDVIKSIYDFCDIEYFDHNYNKIVNKYHENDKIYGLIGQHDVRPQIGFRKKTLINI